MSITVTLTGSTWAEIRAQAREIAAGGTAPMAGHAPAAAPSSLPFPPPGQAPAPPPPAEGGPVCQEHGHTLKLKPAGVSRQGNAYAAGYRCPEQGCRTFIPVAPVAS